MIKEYEELVKKGQMLTEQEYDALDYYLDDSGLLDSGFYIKQEKSGKDYFYDEEENKKMCLKSGLQVVYESMVLEYVKEYPSDVKSGLKEVFKRLLNIDLNI